jgi:hypothetical protein
MTKEPNFEELAALLIGMFVHQHGSGEDGWKKRSSSQ